MTIEKKLTEIEKRDKKLWAKLPEEKKEEVIQKLFTIDKFKEMNSRAHATILNQVGKHLSEEYMKIAANRVALDGLWRYSTEDRFNVFIVFGKYNVFGKAAEQLKNIPSEARRFKEIQKMYSNRPKVVDQIHNL